MPRSSKLGVRVQENFIKVHFLSNALSDLYVGDFGTRRSLKLLSYKVFFNNLFDAQSNDAVQPTRMVQSVRSQ